MKWMVLSYGFAHWCKLRRRRERYKRCHGCCFEDTHTMTTLEIWSRWQYCVNEFSQGKDCSPISAQLGVRDHKAILWLPSNGTAMTCRRRAFYIFRNHMVSLRKSPLVRGALQTSRTRRLKLASMHLLGCSTYGLIRHLADPGDFILLMRAIKKGSAC
jgi:hypothetical protein